MSDLLNRLQCGARQRFGVAPLGETRAALRHAAHTALTEAIWRVQRPLLDDMLSCLFGYHLLEMSAFGLHDLSRGSTINHRFALAPSLADGDRVAGLAAGESLPLPADALDVVLLHHILEYSPRPQQVLKEVAQTIVPHGHLLIVGFNPLSLLGPWQRMGQLLGRQPLWRRHSLRLGRLLDWLHLLDFEPVDIRQGFYRLPLNQPWLLQKQEALEPLAQRLRLPCGGFYIIVARKNVCGRIPAKSRREPVTPVFGFAPGTTSGLLPGAARPSWRRHKPSRLH